VRMAAAAGPVEGHIRSAVPDLEREQGLSMSVSN